VLSVEAGAGQKADGDGDARVNAKPLKNMFNVFVDGALADAKDGRDSGIGFSFANPVRDFAFALA
jgi:hypothetical protein